MCQQQGHCLKWSLIQITIKGAEETIHLLVDLNIMGLLKVDLQAIIPRTSFTTHMANKLSQVCTNQ